MQWNLNGDGDECTRNHMKVWMEAKTKNESLARMVVACFLTEMNPTIEEVSDVKTAVSEAVTNAIIHGYEENQDPQQQVELICDRKDNILTVQVIDTGVGIADINKAKEPFFTTKPEQNRSGMGFAFMEAFMDDVQVESTVGSGTKVTMTKCVGRRIER